MKRLLLLLALLLFPALALGQQQGESPYDISPYGLDKNPAAQLPPDTKAPAPQEVSPAWIEQQIQVMLDSEPTLDGTAVKVTVDETSVVLFGTVNSAQEHDLVLQVAKSYARERKIIDQLTIRGRS